MKQESYSPIKNKISNLQKFILFIARGRNCQSSNPETSTQHEHNHTTNTATESDDNSSHRSLQAGAAESDDDSILFSTTPQNSSTTTNEMRYNESWTSNVVIEASEDFKNNQNRLPGFGAAYPAFGTFVRWRDEPPLPTKYTHPIEMPSSEIQMHMIDLFFKTRYKIAPMFPKRLFYEQLRIKGPLITPFLLNSIYCTVSGYSTLPDIPKPSVFYNRAKKMLDDFLDTPRVSTAAALCLLALYEPLPTKSKNMPDQHCRSWMYSGMASRMCLELGLNIDTPRARANKSPEEIELCRRVFWSCYCLDKMQSAEWERLWSIPASLARTAFPQLLPGDDEEERGIVMAYEQKIRLALIGEEGLQIRASFSIRQDIQDEQYFRQLEEHRLKLLKWRSNLKLPELWGLSHCDTVEQVIQEPKRSPTMSYLHIIYYFMLVDTICCLPDNETRSLEHRIYAAQLTKSIDVICDEPHMVIRYEFLAHAAIASIRVHGRYINSPDQEVARQSWIFFHQCVKILRRFQKHAIIPECSAILAHLPALCQQDLPRPLSSDTSSLVQASSAVESGAVLYQDVPQVPSHHPHQQQQAQQQQMMMQQQQQQDQVLYDNSTTSNDAYRSNNDMSSLSIYGSYQSLADSMVIPTSSTSIGVDFGDRRQLWEHALQDVLNESTNQYDIGSSATTPESTTTPLTYSNDWSSTSPRTTNDFIWPTAVESSQQLNSPQQQQMSQQQQQLQHMISSSPTLQQQQQQQQEQQHFMPQQQRQQPSYNLSSSSPHHHHQMYVSLSSHNINSHHQQQSYVQEPHHQIPSSSSLPFHHHHNMHTNLISTHNVVGMPTQQAYYPN